MRCDEEILSGFESLRAREIGYVLAKDCWGQGLMTEAVKEVIRWLFEEMDLDVIFCSHFLRNRRSARVQEKCGFHHCCFCQVHTALDTVEDDEKNLLYREEWRSGWNKAFRKGKKTS